MMDEEEDEDDDDHHHPSSLFWSNQKTRKEISTKSVARNYIMLNHVDKWYIRFPLMILVYSRNLIEYCHHCLAPKTRKIHAGRLGQAMPDIIKHQKLWILSCCDGETADFPPKPIKSQERLLSNNGVSSSLHRPPNNMKRGPNKPNHWNH